MPPSLLNLPKHDKPTIAIDPGGTTGIAILLPDGTVETTTFHTIKGSKPPKIKVEFVPQFFFKFLKAVDWHAIVIENFVADNMVSKFGLYTIQLVGAVKMFGFMTNTPVYVHMPQYRYSSKKQMTELLAGREVVIHERDATMHLLAFIEKGPMINVS